MYIAIFFCKVYFMGRWIFEFDLIKNCQISFIRMHFEIVNFLSQRTLNYTMMFLLNVMAFLIVSNCKFSILDHVEIFYEDGEYVLEIYDTEPSDKGTYKCVASNEVGSAETQCKLTLRGNHGN